MSPAEFIRRKRNGEALAACDIRHFVEGIGNATVSEGQIAAFAMAAFLNGMSPDETAALTLAMRDSGDVIDWSDTPLEAATILDKHSSGGTGDEKVSLIVAPLVATCGVHMPMISARGLGHTGGEVDLMEAIPGCDIAPPADVFKQAVEQAGCAIIGPTGRLAPADAAIYYVRDVTATVESVPLITSSILSKKLAAGISGLVMSVNFGSGAFMPTVADANRLSSSLIAVAKQAGLPMVTLVTDMDEVMGDAVGSRLQVLEAIRFLDGSHRDPRMLSLVMALCADILLMAGICGDETEALGLLRQRLDDGSALKRFGMMVASLGGPPDLVEAWGRHLETAPYVMPVTAPTSGYVAKVDAFAIGLAMVGLGAGRKLPTDSIDHGVGLTGMVHLGDAVRAGDTLCVVHARDAAAFGAAAEAIRRAITISPDRPATNPVIVGRMTTRDMSTRDLET
ncbi:thymidine phosphorylase [Rhizobium sp. NPDC090275]|uniref:thymidine phosphorylase n=1 Tax=Rhizobium sp. NPDC090275 TaxID=3364498 RepID=UPI003839DC92